MDHIKLENITKKYNGEMVIKDLSMSIRRGEFVIILGESGSGKTTLLNLISQLEIPEGGHIKYENQTINNIRKEKLAYIYQGNALIENETVLKNIKYVNKNMQEIEKILGQLNFKENILEKKIFKLSGGEKQRVSIARAILQKTEILLADEPTSNLDNVTAQLVLNMLKELNEMGKTIILITHDTKLVEAKSTIYYLKGGKLHEAWNV